MEDCVSRERGMTCGNERSATQFLTAIRVAVSNLTARCYLGFRRRALRNVSAIFCMLICNKTDNIINMLQNLYNFFCICMIMVRKIVNKNRDTIITREPTISIVDVATQILGETEIIGCITL